MLRLKKALGTYKIFGKSLHNVWGEAFINYTVILVGFFGKEPLNLNIILINFTGIFSSCQKSTNGKEPSLQW